MTVAGRPTDIELDGVLSPRVRASAMAKPEPRPSLANLFREHSAYVARVAHALLGRDADVDDVVQETFVDAMRGLGQLRDPASARSWLRIITVRRARAKLRGRKLRAWFGFDEAPAYLNVAAPGLNPEERAVLARIYALLDELPVDVRLAWTLRHVEGERMETVAELCGFSIATAKRRVAEGERHLKERLDDE